jgi:hypothetical protein
MGCPGCHVSGITAGGFSGCSRGACEEAEEGEEEMATDHDRHNGETANEWATDLKYAGGAAQAVRAVLMTPGGDLLNSSEVARMAGVSRATVDRVRKALSPQMAGLTRLRRAWQEATAEEKRQFLDEVIQEGR